MPIQNEEPRLMKALKMLEDLEKKLEEHYDIFEIDRALEKCLLRFFTGNSARSYSAHGPTDHIVHRMIQEAANSVHPNKGTVDAIAANIRDAIVFEAKLQRKKKEPLDDGG